MGRTAEMVLGILGGIFGILSGIFAVAFGGLGAAFGANESSKIIGLGLIAVILGIVGIIGGAIANRNIKWSRNLMLFSGILGFIAVSAFWIIAGLLLIVGGLLATRKNKDELERIEISHTGKISLTEKLGKMGIPGFRSRKKWKMAISVVGYFFIFLILIAILFPSQNSSTISKQSPTTVQKSTPTQAIYIKHSYRTANIIGDYNKAPQSKTFLIITFDIENKGYNKFNTNSFYWEVEVNKLRYSTSSSTFSLADKLDLVDIQDGGKINGSLAFEVPEGTNNYTIFYNAPFTKYNIVWK